jgi:hypothetical protein
VLRGAVAIADSGIRIAHDSLARPRTRRQADVGHDYLANNDILDCIVDFVFSEIE